MDVDLTELDDWLGTLEELQLGLERSCNHTAPERSTQRPAGKSSSCPNHAHINGPKSPLSKPANSMNLQTNSAPPLSPAFRISPLQEQRTANSVNNTLERKGASAEGDLNSLLRELQVVEERMRVLEQDDTTASQRYSLSSPAPYQSNPPPPNKLSAGLSSCSSTPFQNSSNSQHYLGYERRLVSAQWAAKLNQDTHQLPAPRLDRYSMQTPSSLQNGTSTQISSNVQFQSSPKHAVASPTGQRPTSEDNKTLASVEDPERSVSASQTTLVNAPTNPISHTSQALLPPITFADVQPVQQAIPTPAPPTRYLTKPTFDQNHLDQQALIEQLHVFQVTENSPGDNRMSSSQSEQAKNLSMPSSPAAGRGNPILVETFSAGSSQFSAPATRTSIISRTSSSLRPLSVVPPNGITDGMGLASKVERSPLGLGNEDFCAVKPNQFRQGPPPLRPDLFGSRSARDSSVLGADRLSSSLSPDSSLSERSLSDATDYSRPSDGSTDSNTSRRPIFVRVFRPDRTTKAVLVEENTTAGEMASMLIEKNFMQPATSLVLVEKVPSMKIERIFEEHQLVSDCILSWSTKSQNMLFFEDRTEQFGFIEAPNKWLGDSFVQKHGYQTTESLQTALENLDKVGFPEYRDYLYIKKPGEKSWSRRLCVLRSSGLYTSKKNKKSLNPSDLIRILILDSQLQLYTTTGGWSRMRAPTPHGFAFKPYSAHDLSSTHVFCFCAADEMALRQWVCRLRIAKYGRQLLSDYRTAIDRVQRLSAFRQGSISSSLLCLSTAPMSVQLHRKSVIDLLGQRQSALSAAESTSSLVSNTTDSPSVIQRLSPEHGQALNSPNGQAHGKHVNWGKLGAQSPSPVPFRSRHSTGGSRFSTDYTPKPDSSTGLKQQLPHSDVDHEVSNMCRQPTQVYSVNSYYASPRIMNGNHLLPTCVPRPRI